MAVRLHPVKSRQKKRVQKYPFTSMFQYFLILAEEVTVLNFIMAVEFLSGDCAPLVI